MVPVSLQAILLNANCHDTLKMVMSQGFIRSWAERQNQMFKSQFKDSKHLQTEEKNIVFTTTTSNSPDALQQETNRRPFSTRPVTARMLPRLGVEGAAAQPERPLLRVPAGGAAMDPHRVRHRRGAGRGLFGPGWSERLSGASMR